MATRRGFLAGLIATALPRPVWADVGNPAYLAAGKHGDGFALHGLSAAGESLFHIPLPARGHAAAAHPERPEVVAFARRPGTFAFVIDCMTGVVRHRLTPPEGRQFNGHGAFLPDGALLMTSEVVAETSEGRVGLWSVPGYRRIGEWASGGIGPHEIRWLPGKGLVVANGGIATDPKDRTKLNIEAMRPNLTLLGSDGRIADTAELPAELHQNSIRHLALIPAGGVAFAMQWEGDPSETVPQLGLWRPGSTPVLCPPRDQDVLAMKGYAGSIAASGGMIALTSPPGGVVMLFDNDGIQLARHDRADLSGVAPAGDGFLLTDGLGAVWGCGARGLRPLSRHDMAWDNHLVVI
ncbi:MAG: DUF1513 domain-containing protein [Paracoccaceae bacterium]